VSTLCGVILGAGAQGRVTLETWRLARPNVHFVFLDDDPKTHGTTLLGAPIDGPFALAYKLAPSGHENGAIIAIGNNKTRLAIARAMSGAAPRTEEAAGGPYRAANTTSAEAAAGVRWARPAIHPWAMVSPSAMIGRGTVVFPGAVVHTGAVVGAHVVINTGVIVEHDAELSDGVNLSPGVKSGGRIVIGEGTFVATGATLAPRVRIGAWSVIGAGSVVVDDIPDRVLAYGVPARPVAEIDDTFDWKRLL
jgi:acetyltransferase-like isoleucine patch superfamily enzyme